MRTKLLILLAALTTQLAALAQSELGLPFIRNYPPAEYHEAPQNLSIAQDHRGVMYFANNAGIIEYDGVNWRTLRVTNKTSVLSVAVDSNGIVYAGAQAELGYLQPGEHGEMQYVSLMKKVPEKDRIFNDVWQVLPTKDGVFFRTDKNLLLYHNGKFTVYTPTSAYLRMYNVYGETYIVDHKVGLVRFINGKMVKVKDSELFGSERIYAMFPYPGAHIMVVTAAGNFFLFDPHKEYVPFTPFKTNADELLKNSYIYQGTQLPGGKFALATVRNGIFIFSNNGTLLQHLTKRSGLQDDIATYVYLDKENNLWVAHNNGISKIDVTSPLTFFDYGKGLHTEVESMIRHEGTLYLATFQGVFTLDTKGRDSLTALPEFRLIPGSEAQCFCFAEMKQGNRKRLLMGSADGISLIENNTSKHLWTSENVFRMFIPSDDPSMLFCSSSNGLLVFRMTGDKLEYLGKQPHINDQLYNIVEQAKGDYWISTAYTGVIRCRAGSSSEVLTTKNIDRYDTLKGVPTMQSNFFWKWNDNVVLATEKGLYEYDSKTDRFVKSEKLGDEFLQKYGQVFIFENDHHGGTWVATLNDDYKGVVHLRKGQNGKMKLEDAPFRRMPEMAIFSIMAEENNVAWIGGSEGLMRYDDNVKQETNVKYDVLIRKVRIGKDSVLFSGSNYNEKVLSGDTVHVTALSQAEDQQVKIEYRFNTMLFEFAALNYFDERSNRYSYYLEDFDEGWSNWSKETKKEYTNLPPGTYTFHVKAINLQGNESREASYTFSVLPPWYRTAWAYLLYLLLFILLVYLLVKISVRRLTIQKEKLERVVQERTHELREEKELVETQKNSLSVAYREIEQKNKDITDSINYARRIQEAMLPSAKRMAELLPDSFVYYQPKDIISGDFYWFGEKNGKYYVAAADCTGHGVPGALMSMIGINFLNQLVNEQQLTSTAEILNRLHINVLRALNEDISLRQSKDGMDIALICIDQKARTIQYSGAVRPLYCIMNNELNIIKGDRFSIGGIKSEEETFTSHTFTCDAPASLYMFSDGYIDQFGGPASGGKKFMAKRLQDLVLRIHTMPAAEQRKVIAETMNAWKDGTEQVDDMLVLGVKF